MDLGMAGEMDHYWEPVPDRGPRSCTGRYRCSSKRLIKRRHSARPLISGRRLAAGWSRGIHDGGTFSRVDDWGSSRRRGLPVGRSVGGEEGQAGSQRRWRRRQRIGLWLWLGLGFGLGISGVKGATLHIRSVVSAGEQPRPAPFAPLKADTTGLIKTPTNK